MTACLWVLPASSSRRTSISASGASACRMAGGIGGFYLASSLGYSRQLTGSYQAGFLIFAALAVFALIGLTAVKTRWRTTWGAAHLTSAKI